MKRKPRLSSFLRERERGGGVELIIEFAETNLSRGVEEEEEEEEN